MRNSRKIAAPIISATVACIVLTGFWTIAFVQDETMSHYEIFQAIWPILLCSSVAVILVMSLLHQTLMQVVVELEKRELEAQERAMRDPLTGLANRALFEENVKQAIHRHRRYKESIAVLMLDLDRFKEVNDALGHAAGDELVRQVAQRLTARLRDSDTVARIGGDEFAVLLTNGKGRGAIGKICDDIIRAVNKPFTIDGREVSVGVSIGSVIASDEETGQELMRKADITMYEAKGAGRNCHRLFNREMDRVVQRKTSIERALRESLDSGDGLDLHYQPIVAAGGAIQGFEGLLRWTAGELGAVPPREAVEMAEECGLADRLGERIFRKACEAARAFPQYKFSINLSPVQFRDSEFAGFMAAIADAEQVPYAQFQLEVTENLFIERHVKAARVIEELRALGFAIALDDFGTGYSSLSYLRQFQVDALKIDRSFIEQVDDPHNMQIVQAVVTLGRAMDLQITAEGVASAFHEKIALEAGVDLLQGHYYAEAQPFAKLPALVAQWPKKAVQAASQGAAGRRLTGT